MRLPRHALGEVASALLYEDDDVFIYKKDGREIFIESKWCKGAAIRIGSGSKGLFVGFPNNNVTLTTSEGGPGLIVHNRKI